MKWVNETLDWFRKEENLENVRTGSTITFILIFVVYFYGFRTGFAITPRDISDIVIDMAIFIISAIVVINDFTMRGVRVELKKEDERRNELQKEHKELTSSVDELHLAKRLIEYNKKDLLVEQEKAKQKRIEKIEKKRRKYLALDDKKSKDKIKFYDNEIKRISNPKYGVKVKFRPTTVDDLLKTGVTKEKDEKIDIAYSPYKDTIKSQSSMVTATVLLTNILRFALEPSWDNFWSAVIFLSILIPFLVIRAIVSYELARYNVEHKYPISIMKQVSILKWCLEK